MDVSLLIGFIIATMGLAIMPGPDNVYVLTESLSRGARQGVYITTGLISGVLVHTTLVATGLSLLVFQYDWAYLILKFAGAAYLLYLAFLAYKEKPMTIETTVRQPRSPFLELFKRGFLMNVLNPKVSVFFIAFLPQFVSDAGWTPMLQMMVLGAVFMVVSFAVFSSIAMISGYSAELLNKPAFWVFTKWLKIFIMIGLAILLAVSQS